MSTKKSNKISVVKSVNSNIDNCIINATTKEENKALSGNINHGSYYDHMFLVANIATAAAETAVYTLTGKLMKAKNDHQSALSMLCALNAENENRKNSTMIETKAFEIISAMTAIGITMTYEQAKANARQALNLHTSITNKPVKRLSINTDNKEGNKIDFDLINRCLVTYKTSYAKLPLEEKIQFSTSSQERFNQLSGYFQQLLTQGQTGKGFIAECIRQNRLNDLTSSITAMDGSVIQPVSGSTIRRFHDALKLYQSI